jgi:LmbE family N-acetylglucosaminyl deacetylase
MSNNVLAVGAHPDDIEMGCGATLAKHLELGDKVHVLVLTKGEKGGHSSHKKECLASLKKFGLKQSNIIFANFADGFISDDFKTVSFIENCINELGINKVYTHYPDDRHQDHRNCSNAVSAAARKVPEILLFQGPSTRAFDPHYFVEVSRRHMAKKLDALNCYASQIKKRTVNPEIYEILARFHGASHNSRYVEAFAINHMLKRDNDV